VAGVRNLVERDLDRGVFGRGFGSIDGLVLDERADEGERERGAFDGIAVGEAGDVGVIPDVLLLQSGLARYLSVNARDGVRDWGQGMMLHVESLARKYVQLVLLSWDVVYGRRSDHDEGNETRSREDFGPEVGGPDSH
jgi:hypothetical protein